MENLYLMKKAIYLLHHVNSMLRYRKSPISVSATINTLLNCVLDLKVYRFTSKLILCISVVGMCLQHGFPLDKAQTSLL